MIECWYFDVAYHLSQIWDQFEKGILEARSENYERVQKEKLAGGGRYEIE